SSRRRHTRFSRDWSSDVCSSDLRHRWFILALISLPVFIGALDLTIISAVLPSVVIDLEIPLETGLDDAAWAVSGYLMAYAITMKIGRASRRERAQGTLADLAVDQ